jgi:hypothetical protein
MKTAEEVAEELAKKIKSLLNFEVISRQDSENVSAVVQEISQALTAYADLERVKEAFDDGYRTGYGDRHTAVEKIRAEALEEAAKCCEKPDCQRGEKCYECDGCGEVPNDYFAAKIRALKEKP